jgi:hypothetical protein
VRVRYGYRRIHVVLRREGWRHGQNKTRWVYRELGLQLRNERQLGVRVAGLVWKLSITVTTSIRYGVALVRAEFERERPTFADFGGAASLRSTNSWNPSADCRGIRLGDVRLLQAEARSANAQTATAIIGGFPCSFSVISVMTRSGPSAPTNSRVRS